ncbi:FAD/NAD(P)-binding domain-containing protein [Hysterangium stoloniferum]|nr:FAD/NAD(P)-binding domain-containing protein [Hysterangium stoloniferum]
MGGTKSMSDTPLRIIIVGAGLGGLAAALTLRKQGHSVEIFESSSFNNEIGAGIGLPPNATRILKTMPINWDNLGCVPYHGVSTFSHDGSPGLAHDIKDIDKLYGEGWFMCHRVDLHTELKRLATSDLEGYAPLTKLHVNSPVTACDWVRNIITLASGESHEADLIIGADGIRSTVRASFIGNETVVPPTGISSFRCIIETSLLDDPDFDWIRDGPSGPRIVTSKEARLLFIYPCRNGTLLNILGMHRDLREQDSCPWSCEASTEAMVDYYNDFHPHFKKLLNMAQNVGLWQMRSCKPLPAWAKGATCVLGDAAHAMLPTFGQGFATTLEDAVTLGVFLQRGTTPGTVETRLCAYECFRRERVEFIAKEALEQMALPSKRGLFYRSREMRDRIMGYDVKQAADGFYAQNFSNGQAQYPF